MRFQINSAQVISEIIDGEAVMINLTSGNYYSLGKVGGEIWDSIERSEGLGEIVDGLAARYAATRDEIERAVRALVEELRREELIVPADGNGAEPASAVQIADSPEGGREPFREPKLEKHTDMQDLILLDPVHEVDERGWPHQNPGVEAGRA